MTHQATQFKVSAALSFLKWQVRIPITRPARYPIYDNARDDSKHHEGTMEEYNNNPGLNPAEKLSPATIATVNVFRLIGFGSTKEKAEKMAERAIV